MTNGEDWDSEELLRRYASGERCFTGIQLADGSVLSGADLSGATFENGFFSDIDVRCANLRRTIFRNMNLKCTDFRGADLTDALFEDVLIEAAAFKGAIVQNTLFRKLFYHGNELVNFCPEDWDI